MAQFADLRAEALARRAAEPPAPVTASVLPLVGSDAGVVLSDQSSRVRRAGAGAPAEAPREAVHMSEAAGKSEEASDPMSSALSQAGQDIVCIPMIVAALLGPERNTHLPKTLAYGRALPGLKGADLETLEEAASIAFDRIKSEGARAVFADVSPRLAGKPALTAMLLATDLAVSADLTNAEAQILRPMAKRLSVPAGQMDAILDIIGRRHGARGKAEAVQ